MKRAAFLFSALLAACAWCAPAASEPAATAAAGDADAPSPLDALAAPPAFAEDASAAEILAACRAMVPQDVVIEGRIDRRSRHGTVIAAYRYRLVRKAGKTELKIYGRDGAEVPFSKEGRLLDTDIVWSDLALDFLWWSVAEQDAGSVSESIQGITCRVLTLRDGGRAVRVWIDRRTGAMLQAQELDGDRVARELFSTSLKKFGDRWAPRNIEVGPPGAKYRTKIKVESVEPGGTEGSGR